MNPQREDEYEFEYVGVGGVTFNGTIRAKDKGEDDWNSDPPPLTICFVEGTIIETDSGPRPDEALLPGDKVRTRDNGIQPIDWIGKRKLDSIDLARHPQLCPVRIKAGAMDGQVPYIDLVVSQQHRILLSDWRAELLFGEAEVVSAAVHLTNDDSIVVERDRDSVTYYHLLFERQET